MLVATQVASSSGSATAIAEQQAPRAGRGLLDVDLAAARELEHDARLAQRVVQALGAGREGREADRGPRAQARGDALRGRRRGAPRVVGRAGGQQRPRHAVLLQRGRAGELLGDGGDDPARAVGLLRAQGDRAVRQRARAGRRPRPAARPRRRRGARAARAPARRRRRRRARRARGPGRQRHQARPGARCRAAAAAGSRPSASAITAPSDRAPGADRRLGGQRRGHPRRAGRRADRPRSAAPPPGARRPARGAIVAGALRRRDDGDRAARGLGREPRDGGEPAAGRDGLDMRACRSPRGAPGRASRGAAVEAERDTPTAEAGSRPFARGQDRLCRRLAFAMLPRRDPRLHLARRRADRALRARRAGRGAGPARRRLRAAHDAARRGVGARRRRRRRRRAPRAGRARRRGRGRPARRRRGRPARRARRRARGRRGQGAGRRPRRRRRRHPDDAERRRDDARPPPRPRGRSGHAARAPADRAQRPGAERLAARGRAARRRPPTRSATRSRAR